MCNKYYLNKKRHYVINCHKKASIRGANDTEFLKNSEIRNSEERLGAERELRKIFGERARRNEWLGFDGDENRSNFSHSLTRKFHFYVL